MKIMMDSMGMYNFVEHNFPKDYMQLCEICNFINLDIAYTELINKLKTKDLINKDYKKRCCVCGRILDKDKVSININNDRLGTNDLFFNDNRITLFRPTYDYLFGIVSYLIENDYDMKITKNIVRFPDINFTIYTEKHFVMWCKRLRQRLAKKNTKNT